MKDFHVTDVLPGDPGDGNVVDVHLFPADEVEQQIQRPVIDLQVDAIVAHTPVIVATRRALQIKLFGKKRGKKEKKKDDRRGTEARRHGDETKGTTNTS
jgi:hypothetical protein